MRRIQQRREPRKGELRINERIQIQQVRLVKADEEQAEIVPIETALKVAKEAGLDLVEIAPTAKPPVCRIMDYSKYRYEQERQERESRQHQRHSHLKELRFRPRIDDHDYQTKMRSLVKFLERGDKVKVTLVFRGGEMAHQEFGHRLLDRLQGDIADIAQVERAPVQEGRFVFMTVGPKKSKIEAKKKKEGKKENA